MDSFQRSIAATTTRYRSGTISLFEKGEPSLADSESTKAINNPRLRIYVTRKYTPSNSLFDGLPPARLPGIHTVSWRLVGLAVYAIALVLAGVYGYSVMNLNAVSRSSSLCSSEPASGDALPNCLPSETIAETGSASFYPLANLWIKNFSRLYPNVQINTQNTGSGTGQSFVAKGLVQIGGSSAYLSDAQQAANPSVLNIPLAVTADIIEYNIPGFPQSIHLNFTATLLTQIYNSTVVYWNATEIKQVNPGAANLLPYRLIWPTYRSDAEGDTLVFTQYLSNDPWWNSTIGSGLQVSWPACPTCPSTPQSSLGNPGIVLATGKRDGAISYVSVEALDQWVLCKTRNPLCSDFHLSYGLLQNKEKHFVEATLDNIEQAIGDLAPQTPADERLSLTNAPGPNSYPIVGYEYALVNKHQVTPEFALVLRAFLRYCLLPAYGNSLNYLGVYHYAPLPGAITRLSLDQVAQIGL